MGKERERNINVRLLLVCPLLGTWPATQACALDWEWTWQLFGLQARAQSTELHQPGLLSHLKVSFIHQGPLPLNNSSVYLLRGAQVKRYLCWRDYHQETLITLDLL